MPTTTKSRFAVFLNEENSINQITTIEASDIGLIDEDVHDIIYLDKKLQKTSISSELLDLYTKQFSDESDLTSIFSENINPISDYCSPFEDEEELTLLFNDLESDSVSEGIKEESPNVPSRDDRNFSYSFYKMAISRHHFKVMEGNVYYYVPTEGYFLHLTDLKLKTLLRSNWDDSIEKHLNKYCLGEVIDRIVSNQDFNITSDFFNNQPHLINLLNCTLDTQTGEKYLHSPVYGFTSYLKVNYNQYPSEAANFKSFLKKYANGDVKKEKHLQEVIGYLISDYYHAKKVPFFIGKKDSGKSTLLRLITRIVGNENVSNIPLHKLNERFSMSGLHGKKINTCSELNTSSLKNIDVFKSITGNDWISAEYKGKDIFSFISKVKLVFSGNAMPHLDDLDGAEAFYERLTFLNFNYSIPREECDPYFEDKLWGEVEWIVNWAITGLIRLVKNNFVFTEPDDSINYKKQYMLQHDHLSDFVTEGIVLDPEGRVSQKMLLEAYMAYCNRNSIIPLKRDLVFSCIVSKYNAKKKKLRFKNTDNPLWGFEGITLL